MWENIGNVISEDFSVGTLASADSAKVVGSPSVSVLVTARNYGRYLGSCLESVCRQTTAPTEIVYCDDGSDDDSVEIARGFPGVTVLAREHAGVAAARNAAVAASQGELLVHVDGDDVLPPDFLEKHCRALAARPDAVFAYGPANAFGLQKKLWCTPEWDRARLWIRNYVNTSAIYRRWAFEAAGGWRDGAETCWDWDLALRVSRYGCGVVSDATLDYRQHQESWSRRLQARLGPHFRPGRIYGKVRRMAARISICSILSGRLPELFPKWLSAIAQSVRDSGTTIPSLVLLDCAPEAFRSTLYHSLSQQGETFSDIRCVRHCAEYSWKTERERRDRVAEFMARACNRVLDLTNSEIVWFVEDDIIVPRNAYSDLLRLLTDGTVPKAAVAGMYRNRHVPDEFVAHYWDHEIQTLRTPPREPTTVDMTGTGCLMMFRPFANHRFQSHVRNIPAHDWAWCVQLKKRGTPVVIIPGVQCRHHRDNTVFV